MSRERRSDCPVHFGLQVFGDAWTLLILRDLLLKDRSTYSDFLNAEEGIATNVLADRLSSLEAQGLVVADRGGGRRSRRYRPTQKAIDLLPVLMQIIAWSAKYDEHTAADRTFVRRLRKDPGGLERELRARLVAAESPIHPSTAVGQGAP